MQETNPEIAKPFPQGNLQADVSDLNHSNCDTPSNRPQRRVLFSSAMTAVAIVFTLGAMGLSLCSVSAAQTRATDLTGSSKGDQVAQLPAIEMRSSVQAAVDDLKKQEDRSTAQHVAKLGDPAVQTTKPVGMFQTSNCINPHPGSARQNQQQIDQCHVQIWFKYNDGCTGYKTAVAQGSGGANCGNGQAQGDDFVWTYCAPKHTP